MDTSYHSINTLFAQLGLANSQEDIAKFVEQHKGLDASTPLSEASFWNQSQVNFLHEAIAEDADWAEVVDTLDAMLR